MGSGGELLVVENWRVQIRTLQVPDPVIGCEEHATATRSNLVREAGAGAETSWGKKLAHNTINPHLGRDHKLLCSWEQAEVSAVEMAA